MRVYDVINIDEEVTIQKHLDRLISEGHLKTYEILSINEEFQVVARGSGNNRVFAVVDPQTGAELGDHKVKGQADAQARDANAKAAAKKTKDPKTPEADEDTKKKAKTKAEKFMADLDRKAKYLKGFLSIVGAGYQAYEQIKAQGDMYNNYLLGAYGPVGSPEAVKQYTDLSKAMYGVWVTQTVGIVLNAIATAAVAKRLLSFIRSVLTLGIISTTGVVGAMLAFLAGETVSYGVLWFLSKPNTIETLLKLMWDFPGAQAAMMKIADWSNPVVSGVEKDLRQAMNMDPRKDSQDISTANAYKSGAPGAASGGASSGATGSNSQSQRGAPNNSAPRTAPREPAAPAGGDLSNHPLLNLN